MTMQPAAIDGNKALNASGYEPTEYCVLIKPTEVGEKIGSVFIPEEAREREQYAAITGVIVAASPLAFSYEEWPEGYVPPKVGDEVVYAKYAGLRIKGRDGADYVFMKDKDLVGVAS